MVGEPRSKLAKDLCGQNQRLGGLISELDDLLRATFQCLNAKGATRYKVYIQIWGVRKIRRDQKLKK